MSEQMILQFSAPSKHPMHQIPHHYSILPSYHYWETIQKDEKNYLAQPILPGKCKNKRSKSFFQIFKEKLSQKASVFQNI